MLLTILSSYSSIWKTLVHSARVGSVSEMQPNEDQTILGQIASLLNRVKTWATYRDLSQKTPEKYK